MALPSVVTLGSLAFVVAAGIGYGVTGSASGDPAAHGPVHHVTTDPRPAGRTIVKPIPHRHSSTTAARRHRPNVVPHVLVVVFNNTAINGLAATKAAALEGAGWNVASTGNWHGVIPTDTVYYPPRLRPAAVKLAKALHISRLHPAVAPMQFDRLTVILASG